jgi:hypothetical protein
MCGLPSDQHDKFSAGIVTLHGDSAREHKTKSSTWRATKRKSRKTRIR